MGGDIITFWTGQCGIQLANACWELYALEHCITPDGKLLENSPENDKTFENFFSETPNGQFVPRSILIDLEPTVIDEIKMGLYRKLFNPETLINSFEDAANNFARGFYSCGREIIKSVVEMTRKMTENSNSIQAFMIHHSFGGGTGSGFTSMLLEYLSIEYAKRTKVEYGVFPSPSFSVSVVEPYNTILALHTPMENADLAAFFENESIFRICHNNMDVFEINFSIINRILAQVISGTTASLRFEGPINANIIDFQTNLVPYPRIHFPLLSFYPIVAPSRINHQSFSTQMITEQAFHRENQMSDVHPMSGAYMSCCLLYRGHINIIDVNSTINHLKETLSMPWVDWCPTGFKVGINYQPMVAIPSSGIGYSQRALSLLCNTTAFKSVLGTVNRKFISLYARKCFVHWYVAEGMEESEFKEALEDVLMLEKDYEMIESTSGRENSQTQSEKKNSTKDQSKISKSMTYNLSSKAKTNEISKFLTFGAYSDTKHSTISNYLTQPKHSSIKTNESSKQLTQSKTSCMKNEKLSRHSISLNLESAESESTRSVKKYSSKNQTKICKSMIYNLLSKAETNEKSKTLTLGALLDTKLSALSKYLTQPKQSSMKTKESSKKITQSKTSSMKSKNLSRKSTSSSLESEDNESKRSEKTKSIKKQTKICKSMIYNILSKTKTNEVSKISTLGALLDRKLSTMFKDLTKLKHSSIKAKESSKKITMSKNPSIKNKKLSRNSTSSSLESSRSEKTKSFKKQTTICKSMIYSLLSKEKINEVSKILTFGALLDTKPLSKKSEKVSRISTSSSSDCGDCVSTRAEKKISSKNQMKMCKSMIYNLLSEAETNEGSKVLTLGALLDTMPSTIIDDLTQIKQSNTKTKESSKNITQSKTSGMKSEKLSRKLSSSSLESEDSESSRFEKKNSSKNQTKISKSTIYNLLSKANTNDISNVLTFGALLDTKASTISKDLTQPKHSSTKTKEMSRKITQSKTPNKNSEKLSINSTHSSLESEESESTRSNKKNSLKGQTEMCKSMIYNLLSKAETNEGSKLLTLGALLDTKPSTISKYLTPSKLSNTKTKEMSQNVTEFEPSSVKTNESSEKLPQLKSSSKDSEKLSKHSTDSSLESKESESTRSEKKQSSKFQSKNSKFVTFKSLSEAETNEISTFLTHKAHSDTKSSTISKDLTQTKQSSMKTKEMSQKLTMSKNPSIENETLSKNSKSLSSESKESESNTSNFKAKIKEKMNHTIRISNPEIDSERHPSTSKNNNRGFEADVIVHNRTRNIFH